VCLTCLTFFLLYPNCFHNSERDLNTSYIYRCRSRPLLKRELYTCACLLYSSLYINLVGIHFSSFLFLPDDYDSISSQTLAVYTAAAAAISRNRLSQTVSSSRSTTLWCYCPKIVPYTFCVLTDVLLLCGACQCGWYINVWVNFSDVDSPKTTTWQHGLNNTTKIYSIHTF
jgi:hypothetical protein